MNFDRERVWYGNQIEGVVGFMSYSWRAPVVLPASATA